MTLQITLSSLNWHHSELVTCYVLHSLKVFLLLDWVSLKSKESSLLNLNYSWSETRRIHVFPKGISEKDCNQLTHNLNTTDSIFCASNHYATHKFVHSTVNLKKKKNMSRENESKLKTKTLHSLCKFYNKMKKWNNGLKKFSFQRCKLNFQNWINNGMVSLNKKIKIWNLFKLDMFHTWVPKEE